MIWRLPHPVRGIFAFLVVWGCGATLIGFAVGIPEMMGLTLLASVAFALASSQAASERTASS